MPEKLSFLGRLGLALATFAEGKSVSERVAGFMNGSDVDDSGGAKLQMPYGQSAWVYIAVSRLSEKISSIPFRISRIGGDKAKRIRALRSSSDPRHRSMVRRALGETILESGDVVNLFDRPHPTMNRQLFWEMVVTWNCLRGEFFVLALDDADNVLDLTDPNPRIKRLICVPTGLFSHIVSGYQLMGWRYTGSSLLTPIASQFLLPGEAIHSRTPNPYEYWRGMSPLGVAMVAAGADYAAAQYAKGYWLNNADTGVIVTTEQQADDIQQKQIMAALRERKRKAGTADRPLFLWGGAKVEKPQLSGMEQQFISNREMNRQEIGAIFKVPDSIMGFTGSKATPLSGGGAAIDSEGVAFIENTIDPLCCHLEAAVAPVVKTFGEELIGWFDTDSLPIMQAARRSRVDTAAKAFAIGASFNDVNTVYDLGFEKKPWGDKSFLPFSLQEVSADGLGNDLPSEDPAPPEDDAKKLVARALNFFSGLKQSAPVQKSKLDVVNLWKKHITSRKESVNLVKGKIGKVLMQFKKSTLAKLDEVNLQKAAGQLPVSARGLVDIIFNQHAFGDALNQELQSPLKAILGTAGKELLKEVGYDDPWEYPPKAVQEFLASRKIPILGVGGTVRDRLNTSLMEGTEAGETHLEIAARVKGVFNEMTDAESRRVAMTEVNIGYNTARDQAMNDAGIQFKAWLSSHGPNVRPAHAQAEEDYIDSPIPIDEAFEVNGEQLMFPGDTSLGASLDNIINCQCIQLAAQKKEEDEKSVTYLICGFGVMKFEKRPLAA